MSFLQDYSFFSATLNFLHNICIASLILTCRYGEVRTRLLFASTVNLTGKIWLDKVKFWFGCKGHFCLLFRIISIWRTSTASLYLFSRLMLSLSVFPPVVQTASKAHLSFFHLKQNSIFTRICMANLLRSGFLIMTSTEESLIHNKAVLNIALQTLARFPPKMLFSSLIFSPFRSCRGKKAEKMSKIKDSKWKKHYLSHLWCPYSLLCITKSFFLEIF